MRISLKAVHSMIFIKQVYLLDNIGLLTRTPFHISTKYFCRWSSTYRVLLETRFDESLSFV